MKQVMSARGAAVVALLSSTILGVPAYAQQQPSSQPDTSSPNSPSPGATAASAGGLPQADDARPGVADIVVTGSRISRRDTVANSPIATISGTAFNQTGAVTLEDTLNRLPQFSPGTGATTNDNLSGGITTLNLRGLGSNRTLVLMDGHRLPASTDLGAVDINIIPDALIESVETITGGASAAYGSDAIAGVVNFKINHRFSGIRLDAQNGISARGDGYTFKTSATVGSNFSDGRGNAVLSIGYQQRDAVNNSDRAFSSIVRPSSSLPYGAFIVDADNQPSDAAVKGIFTRYGVAPSRVNGGTNLAFNNDGSLFTYSSSALNYRGSAPDVLLSNRIRYNSSGNNGLILPIERLSAYGRVEHEVGENTTVFLEANFQHFTSRAQYAPAGFTFDAPATNPFIPADLATVLASRPDPGADFTITRRFTDVGFRTASTEYNEFRTAGGASGRLPIGDWTWDAYGSYAQVTAEERDRNGFSVSALQTLLYARDGGRSLCSGGLNVFGNQAGSACASYIRRDTIRNTRTYQSVVEGTIQGSLIKLPGGMMKFAAGADYRKDGYRFTPDSALLSGDVVSFSNGVVPAEDGAITVKEVFAELLVPILADLPAIKKLEVDAGFRYSDYNTFGGIKTYRAEGSWEVVDALRFRGGYARAVRAPSVGELFAPQSQTSPLIGAAGTTGQGDPCDVNGAYRTGANASQVRGLCIAQGLPSTIVDRYTFDNTQIVDGGVTGGNQNLRPETANTYTAGVVVTPGFDAPILRRLNISVDYYNITISKVVGTIDGLTALQRCYNLDGSNPTYNPGNVYCSLFGRSTSTGQINSFLLTNQNLGRYKTSGLDIALDWNVPLSAFGISDRAGSLHLTAAATRLLAFEIQTFPGDPNVNYRGYIGDIGYPKWRSVETLTYLNGGFSIGLQHRYIDGMVDVGLIGTDDRSTRVPAINYFDLNLAVAVSKAFSVRLGVNNLTDAQPPVYDSFSQSNTNPGVYDVLGRAFYAGARVTF